MRIDPGQSGGNRRATLGPLLGAGYGGAVRGLFFFVCGAIGVSGPALAQVDTTTFEEEAAALRRPPPELSADLLEPSGRSRFHLTTRMSLARNNDSLDGPLAMTFVPKFWVSVLPGLAVGAVIPLGLTELPGSDQFFLGNVRLGVMGGTFVPLSRADGGDRGPRLHFAGAFELLIPTLTPPDQLCDRQGLCIGPERARALHAFDRELFFPDTLLARPRAQLAFGYRGFRIGVEGALAAGAYIDGSTEGEAVMLIDFATRVSYDILDQVEPFLELQTSRTLVHPDGIVPPSAFDPDNTPLQLSFGARVYVGELSPSLFATWDSVRSIVFFGLDLTGVLRTTTGQRRDDNVFID